MFLSLDGIDGVGKSTQMSLLVEWLRDKGHRVVTCRDPGSTPLGERLRRLLLQHDDDMSIGARAEMLMYMAARAQLVEQTIAPALADGAIVVSDRYVLANIVYQAYAGGLDVEQVRSVGQVATAGVAPNRVYLLDMPVTSADERLGQSRDRMESRGAEYRRQLRDGFLSEARLRPEQIVVVDAARSIDLVHAAIREDVGQLLS